MSGYGAPSSPQEAWQPGLLGTGLPEHPDGFPAGPPGATQPYPGQAMPQPGLLDTGLPPAPPQQHPAPLAPADGPSGMPRASAGIPPRPSAPPVIPPPPAAPPPMPPAPAPASVPAEVTSFYLAPPPADQDATQYISPQSIPASNPDPGIPTGSGRRRKHAGTPARAEELGSISGPSAVAEPPPPVPSEDQTRKIPVTPAAPQGPTDHDLTRPLPKLSDDGPAYPPNTARTPTPGPTPTHTPTPTSGQFDFGLYRDDPQPDRRRRQPTPDIPSILAADSRTPAESGNFSGPNDPPGSRRRNSSSGSSGNSRSRRPWMLAFGSGIVVLCAAGALLIGALAGSDDDPKPPSPSASPVSEKSKKPSREPAEKSPSSSPTEDPMRKQAKALDTLLKDSGGSRSAVVGAVAQTNKCQNLSGSAAALRGAARQRQRLISRLDKLDVNKLENGPNLAAALRGAWSASASADNHYASWADRTDERRKKSSCKRGRAPHDAHYRNAVRASGNATREKQKAANLWNRVADRTDLPRRQAADL